MVRRRRASETARLCPIRSDAPSPTTPPSGDLPRLSAPSGRDPRPDRALTPGSGFAIVLEHPPAHAPERSPSLALHTASDRLPGWCRCVRAEPVTDRRPRQPEDSGRVQVTRGRQQRPSARRGPKLDDRAPRDDQCGTPGDRCHRRRLRPSSSSGREARLTASRSSAKSRTSRPAAGLATPSRSAPLLGHMHGQVSGTADPGPLLRTSTPASAEVQIRGEFAPDARGLSSLQFSIAAEVGSLGSRWWRVSDLATSSRRRRCRPQGFWRRLGGC
jgi:hypothetical protein